VGYGWPMPPGLPAGWGLLHAAPDLYRRVLTVPGQMAAGLDWVLKQPWVDRGGSINKVAGRSRGRTRPNSGRFCPRGGEEYRASHRDPPTGLDGRAYRHR
jgi:hypothetical protein